MKAREQKFNVISPRALSFITVHRTVVVFRKLCSVIEDYSLVSFVPLNVQDKDSMLNVLKQVDKANGYCFGSVEERNVQKLLSAAVGADFQFFRSAIVHEKYMS